MEEDRNPYDGKSCQTCRFDPDGQNIGAGGDCANCDDKLSEWKEEKRENIETCEKCAYENDSCHCDCVECQDGKNFIPKERTREVIRQEIQKKQSEIERLRFELNEI